jgi:glucose uptake protein GlcU
MESWLIFSIASIFFAGIYSFLIKVAAMKNYNPSMVTGYGYLAGAVFAGIFLFLEWLQISDIKAIMVFAFINVLFYFFSTLTRIESMKNIDSVLFFPIFKTVSPILVTLAGIFLFHEALTTKEIIWIILWISVPLLLIWAHENKRQINLKKGIIFLMISSALVLVSTVMIKQVNLLELNIPLFVFFTMIFGYFISIISNKTVSKKNKNYETKNIFWFGLFMWIFHYASFYCFTRSLEGNLAVAFTINSFAILIPIILSIIFYKDHFNLKKAFVILLSIISIILFI